MTRHMIESLSPFSLSRAQGQDRQACTARSPSGGPREHQAARGQEGARGPCARDAGDLGDCPEPEERAQAAAQGGEGVILCVGRGGRSSCAEIHGYGTKYLSFA